MNLLKTELYAMDYFKAFMLLVKDGAGRKVYYKAVHYMVFCFQSQDKRCNYAEFGVN